MNRIDRLFEETRRDDATAFIPFLTAGDPDLNATVALAKSILEAGKRAGIPLLLEIGFPYTDPIADGATIQASYTRALARGVKVDEIFEASTELRRSTDAPLVAMVSYSLVFRASGDRFLERAQRAGFDGAIIPDLPVEEADAVRRWGDEHDFKIIQLIAPTTPPERAEKIVASCTGFVYFISVTGITGERRELPPELPSRVAALRGKTDLPVCIGFGISQPEQVETLRSVADGVIVGSAIVRRLADLAPNDPASVSAIADFVATLMAPLRRDTTDKGRARK